MEPAVNNTLQLIKCRGLIAMDSTQINSTIAINLS